jgi:hypothetical protein
LRSGSSSSAVVVHRLARAPLLDSLIPIAIAASLAVGVALMVNGFGG